MNIVPENARQFFMTEGRKKLYSLFICHDKMDHNRFTKFNIYLSDRIEFKMIKIFSTTDEKNIPSIIWGEDISHGENSELLFEEIKKITTKDFAIAVFAVNKWNDDFSPWYGNAVFGKDDFGGNGDKTLNYIKQEIIPSVNKRFPSGKKILAGYSLAGLFSLWSLYEDESFDGAVCCSSSLWFDSWKEYSLSHKIKKSAAIYLSLGNLESKTKNTKMVKVEECTQKQIALLSKDINVKKLKFEINEGGHFTEPLKRLAKGIAWIIENCEEK